LGLIPAAADTSLVRNGLIAVRVSQAHGS